MALFDKRKNPEQQRSLMNEKAYCNVYDIKKAMSYYILQKKPREKLHPWSLVQDEFAVNLFRSPMFMFNHL